SLNIHAGSMSYQSNNILVIKEKNCDPDSVFYTIADQTTVGILDKPNNDESENEDKQDSENENAGGNGDNEKVIIDSSTVFTDINSDAWYKTYVDYAYTYGLFVGTSKDTFSPDFNMTRAEFVQVLANISGIDTTNKLVETKFTDVLSGSWYAPAVKWASENGIVQGISAEEFAPETYITREQMCVMVIRYIENYKKQVLKAEIDAVDFSDDSLISDWAKDSVYKCADANLVNGIGNGLFSPKEFAPRSHVVTLFVRFHKEYIK
ncbi:MAG: S-layer homology domain-containing protein, partial [Firmicutes bacterium]|nr:S-layer homology domain-containing protein [Bacillota bacterium]